MTMPINARRRQLVLAGLSLPAMAAFSGGRYLAQQPAPREWLISAQGRTPEQYGAAWASSSTHATTVTGLRGHDVLQHALRPQHLIVVARRPGRELVEIDLLSGRIQQRSACLPHHHLNGHACFSADGRYLFTSESDYQQGTGRLIVRDADNYQVLDSFSSHGIGPHELQLMPDGRTLAVANGGLLTHPDSGRKVLNLDSMRSSLSLIDSHNGELLAEYQVAEPKASIRHLDVAQDGSISVALQMQRQAAEHQQLAPLAALLPSGGNALQVLDTPETLLWHCNDYMGSTRINGRSRLAGFTSPRGDIALFWHIDSGRLAGYHRLHDVCGLTVSLDQKRFILTNSDGHIRQLDAFNLEEIPGSRQHLSDVAWDNHLHAIDPNLAAS
ncbi:hypothetical protein GCM10011297_10090 [Bacterioplanes sanyensis]|uniref:DUF1513 domain-containing protein n=1 Tax=Bacterioplanes sanyensis TaxID=1249553 RepID=UPI00167BD7D4|nr:DUF1513 domain-containing protein [Bacterioplanes sanyensis]GGY38879.1 hypothetical protein GCM10011297_10090 [Bacterioplanes sanyensis]